MSITLAVVFIAAAMLCVAGGSAASWPVPRGSFIQDWLVADWSEARWASEYEAMKQVGMDTLVLQSICDSKTGQTIYPTAITGYSQSPSHNDTLGKCLRAAEKAGIKVFVGLNANNDWWSKGASDASWLNSQMAIGNSVADEVISRYMPTCPHALAGWYWWWEVDNANFNTSARRINLANALNISAQHLHSVSPGLPLMISPFANESLGTPTTYRSLWIYLFANSAFGVGDILCPQDSVGAGGVSLVNVPAWFAAYKAAVDAKPGIRLWSNNETFNQDDWTAATLDRYVAQLKAVQPYVEANLNFAYCHYYSPNLIDAGLQCTMMGYVSSGVLDSNPPTAPTSFAAIRTADGKVHLSWKASKDDMRVFGYEITRNGTRITRKQTARGAAGNMDNPPSYVDSSAPASGSLLYRVRAYDFAGNFSPAVEGVAVNLP